jgi:hypothetical protein
VRDDGRHPRRLRANLANFNLGTGGVARRTATIL